MSTTVRRVTPEDVPQVIEMMREFAEFEDLLGAFSATGQRLAEALFAERAFVRALIAEISDKPVGYTLFFDYFASFSSQQSVYLEDLYIRPEHRGSGIGLKLLHAIAEDGMRRGAERIDFQVLDDNRPAIEFYHRLGAVSNDDETHFKIAGEAFSSLAHYLS